MKEFIKKTKESPKLKALILWVLIPKNQARPRWWVKKFINPFIHHSGKNSLIRKNTRMDLLPFREFSLGNDSTIEDFSVINNGMGAVNIGNGVRIGLSNVVIGPVSIGNQVIIAQNVVMSGLNHGYQDINTPICKQPCSTNEIKIEDECWIGANSVITAGVTIGKHSIIAAGTIVTKDVPPYSVVAGNPGKVIKQYNHQSKSWERVKESPLLKKVS
jgi:acetyltransferase-like isoleucine patch superfamily enzyme